MLSRSSTPWVSVGCNRSAHALAWSNWNWRSQPEAKERSETGAAADLVAFAAGKLVALWDVDGQRLLGTLRGHKDSVVGVAWVDPDAECFAGSRNGDEAGDAAVRYRQLVSVGADAICAVWRVEVRVDHAGRRVLGDYKQIETLKGHKSAMTGVAVHAHDVAGDKDGRVETLMATASSDGALRVWRRVSGREVEAIAKNAFEQSVEVQLPTRQIAQCMDWVEFAGAVLLAVGHVDNRVRVFELVRNELRQVVVLEGHENWVRDVSFCTTDGGDVMLASGSQDSHVRLWRLTTATLSQLSRRNVEQKDDQAADEDEDEEEDELLLSASYGQRGHSVQLTSGDRISMVLDAVLAAHDERVMCCSWQPVEARRRGGQVERHQPMALLSVGTDKTMFVWRPDESDMSEIWINYVRVGLVGGHQLGYYGGAMGPGGKRFIGYSFSGSMHLWQNDSDANDHSAWRPALAVSGHFGPVRDAVWDSSRQYILTTSKDQTTRLFAPWRTKGGSAEKPLPDTDTVACPWYEIARPQIHGYDLNRVVTIPQQPHGFISGADEKVLRVFDAPLPFIQSLSNITGRAEQHNSDTRRALLASVPELGLSNKAVMAGDAGPAITTGIAVGRSDEAHVEQSSAPLTEPPLEEHLFTNTVWPEVDKMYGHGYEILALATTHDGRLLASTSVAKQAKHAQIRVWNVDHRLLDDEKTKDEVYRELYQLPAHTLSVTGLAFSHNDRFLLATSRDRHIAVFDRGVDNEASSRYELKFRTKAHGRIVWDCAWAHDDLFFVTGSRDKTVKVWKPSDSREDRHKWSAVATLGPFKSAVTAVSAAPRLVRSHYVVAVGFENGKIEFWSVPSGAGDDAKWQLANAIPVKMCHGDVVKRVRWRDADGTLQLLSCSDDHSVRLFTFTD